MPPPNLHHLRTRALTTTCLALALWLFSILFHTAFTYYGSWSVGFLRGVFIVEKFTPPLPPGSRLGGQTVNTCRTQLYWSPEWPYWSPKWRSSGPPSAMTTVMVPLWLLVLPAAAIAAIAHRRIRAAARISHCKFCSYDRSGLAPDAVCPECGKKAAAATTH